MIQPVDIASLNSGGYMIILQSVYHTLLYGFPAVPPEAGAILGIKKGIVCTCSLDCSQMITDRAIYTPNVALINRTIQQWKENDISFCGIAHSHPSGEEQLSGSDIKYIKEILAAMPESISELFFPLVFPGEKVLSFIVRKQECIDKPLPDNIIIK